MKGEGNKFKRKVEEEVEENIVDRIEMIGINEKKCEGLNKRKDDINSIEERIEVEK